jgi:hypothetical protein
MQQRNQAGVAVVETVGLLQPSANHVGAARQVRGNPSLQRRLLLVRQAARTAFMAKFAQSRQAIPLIGVKPAANGVVVQQKRSGHLGATPTLVEQNNRIGPPRQPVLRKPVPRQRHQRLTLICRKKAAANHLAHPNPSG